MKAIIFDFDGVLADTSKAIVISVNYALKKNEFKEVSRDEVVALIGRPLEETF